MAASRPPFHVPQDGHPLVQLGQLVELAGAVLALLAGVVAMASGAWVVSGAPGPGAGFESLVRAATAPATTLAGATLLFHWAAVGLAVGCWFLGLGFIVTGYLDTGDGPGVTHR
ncbi:hypothetical protein [Haloarchaeobius sp. TZWWS8]|uniref:hypothetical protein n=1 Tax=Haloarchaeobius sp. TZWWS8 TaxID=3446121 RepID=UPI003EBF765B